jgi:hypothetical protein
MFAESHKDHVYGFEIPDSCSPSEVRTRGPHVSVSGCLATFKVALGGRYCIAMIRIAAQFKGLHKIEVGYDADLIRNACQRIRSMFMTDIPILVWRTDLPLLMLPTIKFFSDRSYLSV